MAGKYRSDSLYGLAILDRYLGNEHTLLERVATRCAQRNELSGAIRICDVHRLAVASSGLDARHIGNVVAFRIMNLPEPIC